MKPIYFFKVGAFSQQNAFIAAELSRAFPEAEVRVVDVLSDIAFRSPVTTLLALGETLRDYPRLVLGQRHDPRIYFPKTRAVQRAVRAWALKNIDPEKCSFTFQSQSLFDASRAGVPHFLYTDHTWRANFRYASASFVPQGPADWPERERKFYENATRCFTTSSFARRSLLEDYGLSPDRAHCVFCGANAVPEPRGERGFGARILFVGVEWERKGGPQLLEAFARVRAAVPEATLEIAGCKPPAEIPGVTTLGKCSLEQVAQLYRTADIFCLPSLKEPSAVVLSEALLHGIPVVATDVGGTADRVIDGRTGFLVPPGDIGALADRLIALCRAPEQCATMGRAGLELARERFSWSAVGERLREHITEAMSAAGETSLPANRPAAGGAAA